jgi:hypothetical protein
MSLVQLQRDLQAHVLDGSGNIETEIDSTESVSISTRLAIYSDAYRLRLIEALESNYPILAELLGADEFVVLSRRFIENHSSQHYSIRWFGHRLAEFFSETQSDQPWLADLARWEWATAHAFDAADATLLTLNDLAAMAPNEWAYLPLRVHPSLTHLQLNSNCVAIVNASAAAIRLPTPMRDESTEWCIWREDLNVRYRSLDAIEARAVSLAVHGTTFGELCEHLANQMPSDAVPLQAASFLKRWIDDQWLMKA